MAPLDMVVPTYRRMHALMFYFDRNHGAEELLVLVLKTLNLPHEFLPAHADYRTLTMYLHRNPSGKGPLMFHMIGNEQIWRLGTNDILAYLIETYDTVPPVPPVPPPISDGG
ncbi:hypothetical protein E0Z10_g7030 [Xylaria hypoxylon]|uniref:GST N-terminal domain-containing protein n=1 Tax=Xylaria hypoxylon TaxID=37992 RepID=A0A4Z0YCP2_9PEZI|nr:hypothetical protein E0Z10_g7030 [Xylaria hypoxylon]